MSLSFTVQENQRLLDLSDCPDASKDDLELIVRSSPLLSHLILSGCSAVTDEVVARIASLCYSLQVLKYVAKCSSGIQKFVVEPALLVAVLFVRGLTF